MSVVKRNIVALGGGGFSMEPHNPLLDKYILGLAANAKPKICFIPTASGDDQDYVKRFYKFFNEQECVPSHLSLFRGTTSDLRSLVLAQDIVYVGGGNTRNLLVLWKDWGLDQILREAWEKGIVLCGISAGSICWFEQGVTDSIPGRLSSLNCLGFLNGSNCPHYDGESERRPEYHKLLQNGEIGAGLAADDGVGFHFVNRDLHRVVSSVPDKRGYRVGLKNGKVEEETIMPLYLGS